MKRSEITNVTRTATEVVRSLVALRATVDAVLVERGEHHGDAAARVGVSGAKWSRTVNSNNITDEQFKMLAEGLDLTVEQLQERCK